jgi:hypothetical protein
MKMNEINPRQSRMNWKKGAARKSGKAPSSEWKLIENQKNQESPINP